MELIDNFSLISEEFNLILIVIYDDKFELYGAVDLESDGFYLESRYLEDLEVIRNYLDGVDFPYEIIQSETN